MEEWLRVARAHGCLTPPTPREIANPFTRSQQVVEPMAGEFDIAGNEDQLGSITPGSEFKDDGELDVWLPDGERSAEVVGILSGITSKLSAEIEWFDDPSD
ncbi:MAG: hypothetical protein U0325_02650 [Polyangiales bacterium]